LKNCSDNNTLPVTVSAQFFCRQNVKTTKFASSALFSLL